MINRLFQLLCIFFCSNACAELQVQQPSRAHGYFIGDVLVQRVRLTTSEAGSLTAPEPLDEQRITTYLYRLAVTEILAQEHVWLELKYQIINSPPATETITLPAVTLTSEADNELTLEPWPFTVSPLTSKLDSSNGAALSILPDRRPLDVIEAVDDKPLKLSVAALLTTLALWLLWWVYRHFTDSHTLPFARANRAIRRLPGTQHDTEPQAFIALHHAFNYAAGKTINTSSLDDLYAAVPWLVDYKDSVETFYRASAARFFQQAESPPHVAIDQLSGQLYRAEKRQAKVASH
ncbi:hypothetical protein AB833_20820 [Chromatiales bacterium (ex Bugula neritina AB1)]|nr:hypothetical protein AB833_20820 [Chromatiales bacterium (ex Bugula neritina AB1)]